MNCVCSVPIWHLIASKHYTVSCEAGLKLLCSAICTLVRKLGGYEGAGVLEKREAQASEIVAARRNIQMVAEIAKTSQAYDPRNRSTCLIDSSIHYQGVYFVRQLPRFAVFATRRNSPLDVGFARFTLPTNVNRDAVCL